MFLFPQVFVCIFLIHLFSLFSFDTTKSIKTGHYWQTLNRCRKSIKLKVTHFKSSPSQAIKNFFQGQPPPQNILNSWICSFVSFLLIDITNSNIGKVVDNKFLENRYRSVTSSNNQSLDKFCFISRVIEILIEYSLVHFF